MNDLMQNILSDLRVELLDEFDSNFTRKAFFDRPWPARRMPGGRGSLLIVSGRLRRSLRCSQTRSALMFYSDAAYFSIHNRGGRIPVTPRMRKYFWAMYYRYAPSSGNRAGAKNAIAEYYKSLALTKAQEFTIPQRQIVGDHPKVSRAVDDICVRHVNQWIAKNVDPKFRKMRLRLFSCVSFGCVSVFVITVWRHAVAVSAAIF